MKFHRKGARSLAQPVNAANQQHQSVVLQDDGATTKPRLGVFGSGSFGGRLAALARGAGYEVVVSKRENAFSVAEQSQIFVIGIRFPACARALPPLSAALEGKIVVVATNPLNPD